jgi:hypothetical protein
MVLRGCYPGQQPVLEVDLAFVRGDRRLVTAVRQFHPGQHGRGVQIGPDPLGRHQLVGVAENLGEDPAGFVVDPAGPAVDEAGDVRRPARQPFVVPLRHAEQRGHAPHRVPLGQQRRVERAIHHGVVHHLPGERPQPCLGVGQAQRGSERVPHRRVPGIVEHRHHHPGEHADLQVLQVRSAPGPASAALCRERAGIV